MFFLDCDVYTLAIALVWSSLKTFFLLFWPIGEEEELPDVRLRHPHLRAVGQSGHTTSKQDTTQVENKKNHKYIQVRVHFYT